MVKPNKHKRSKTGRGAQKPSSRKKVAAAEKARPDAARSTAKRKTKTDHILTLLRQPEGATLKAIMAATGWQAHSVRGFISGHLIKKLGLHVKSVRRDGERVYAINSTADIQRTGAAAKPGKA